MKKEAKEKKARRDAAWARDKAIAKAEGGASYAWLADAEKAIRSVAARKEHFTADDVWDTGLEPPRESRALGAVFVRMKRDGIIAPTDMFKLTKRRLRHAAPIRVWKSLLKASK
jgi:hypothetical protein